MRPNGDVVRRPPPRACDGCFADDVPRRAAGLGQRLVTFARLASVCAVAVVGPLLSLPSWAHVPVVVGELAVGLALGNTGLRVFTATDPTFAFRVLAAAAAVGRMRAARAVWPGPPVVPPAGFEPAPPASGGRCSIP
jgi:hypothetical protein